MEPARERRRHEGSPGLTAAVLLGTLTIAAPQLLGGATPLTHAILCSTSAACAATTWLALGGSRARDTRTTWAVLAALGAVGITALQRLPLPCTWAAYAWPELADLRAALAALHADAQLQCTLSRAPGATVKALASAAAIAAVLAASSALARAGHAKLLAKAVCYSGLTMALVALGHGAVQATHVFGLYAPKTATPGLLLAPLLNGNHLAALCGLALPLAVSESRAAENLERRLLWGGGAALLVLAIGLSLSRGGLLGAAVSVAVLLTRAPRTVRRQAASQPARLLVHVLLALAAAVLCGVLGRTLAPELADTASGRDKLDQIARFFVLALEHPWLGVGRGAFGAVSGAATPGTLRALYAENTAAHWFTEWGVPASLAVGAGLLSSAWQPPRSSERAWATWCGLLGLVVHDTVDFALELPAVALVAAVALGSITRSRTGRAPISASWSLAAATVAALLAAIWFDARVARQRDEDQRLAALAVLASHGEVDAPARALIAATVGDYPLLPALYAYAAGAFVRARSPEAPAWLNLAMERAPRWAAPHIQAAAWLEGLGRVPQAAEELGLASELDPRTAGEDGCRFVARHPNHAVAERLVPDGAHAQAIAEQIVQCLSASGPPSEIVTFARGASDTFSRSPLLRERLIDALLRTRRADEALRLAAQARQEFPDDAPLLATYLAALLANGDVGGAANALTSAAPALRQTRRVLSLAFEVALARQEVAALAEAAGALAKLAESNADTTALALMTANGYLTLNDPGRAMAELRAAYTHTREPALLERVHAIAEAAGLREVALRAALELCHVRHRGDAYCEGAHSH